MLLPWLPKQPKFEIHAWNLAEDISALFFVVSPNLFLLDMYINNKSKEQLCPSFSCLSETS